jgi:hypothetical protein
MTSLSVSSVVPSSFFQVTVYLAFITELELEGVELLEEELLDGWLEDELLEDELLDGWLIEEVELLDEELELELLED